MPKKPLLGKKSRRRRSSSLTSKHDNKPQPRRSRHRRPPIRRRNRRNPHSRQRSNRQIKERTRAFRVLARVRKGESFSAALRVEHTSSRTALKHVGSYLRRKRTKGGKVKYSPIKSDHRVRMRLLGYGPVSLGPRDASLLGKYSAAVGKFARTGDPTVLAPFVGKRIAGHELVTDPQVLLAMGRAGELRVEDLYVGPTGGA